MDTSAPGATGGQDDEPSVQVVAQDTEREDGQSECIAPVVSIAAGQTRQDVRLVLCGRGVVASTFGFKASAVVQKGLFTSTSNNVPEYRVLYRVTRISTGPRTRRMTLGRA